MTADTKLIIARVESIGWRVSYGTESTIVTEVDYVTRGAEALNEAIEFVKKAQEEGYA